MLYSLTFEIVQFKDVAKLFKMVGGNGERGLTGTQNGGSPQTLVKSSISWGRGEGSTGVGLLTWGHMPQAPSGYAPGSVDLEHNNNAITATTQSHCLSIPSSNYTILKVF